MQRPRQEILEAYASISTDSGMSIGASQQFHDSDAVQMSGHHEPFAAGVCRLKPACRLFHNPISGQDHLHLLKPERAVASDAQSRGAGNAYPAMLFPRTGCAHPFLPPCWHNASALLQAASSTPLHGNTAKQVKTNKRVEKPTAATKLHRRCQCCRAFHAAASTR